MMWIRFEDERGAKFAINPDMIIMVTAVGDGYTVLLRDHERLVMGRASFQSFLQLWKEALEYGR